MLEPEVFWKQMLFEESCLWHFWEFSSSLHSFDS